MTPSFTSGCPNLAFSSAIIISQLMASSQPPPRAYPFTAAIVGNSRSSILLKMLLPYLPQSLASSSLKPYCVFISAPATKALPVPVIIRTSASSSFSRSSTTCDISSRTCLLSAFSTDSLEIVIILSLSLLSSFTNSISSHHLIFYYAVNILTRKPAVLNLIVNN